MGEILKTEVPWKTNIKSDLKTMGYEMNTDLIMDEERWKRIVQPTKTYVGVTGYLL